MPVRHPPTPAGPECTTEPHPQSLAIPPWHETNAGIFSCIRPGVITCAACICTEINSPKIILCIGARDVRIQALYQYRGQGPKCEYNFKSNSSKIFSNTGPPCIRKENNSSRCFCLHVLVLCWGAFNRRRNPNFRANKQIWLVFISKGIATDRGAMPQNHHKLLTRNIAVYT